MARVALPRSVPLVGRPEARLFTPPDRRLTRHTSRGHELIAFAREVLGEPLLPWQEWLAIHALELDRSGNYRFRTVLCLVGRQNGKTHFLRCLALWRMYMDDASMVLSVAQSLDIAREAWRSGCSTIEGCADLKAEHERTSRVNGDEHVALSGGRRWKIAAANRSAGRGLSVDLLLLDELREQRSWDAWSALSKTTMARAKAQAWGISNAGDAESVVLNHLREAALAGTDPSIGIFEWSAADGCALDDRKAWAQANPGLGHTVSEQAIASALGTDPPSVFRTEVLCQKVDALDSAISADAWTACADPSGSLDTLRDKVTACLDVAPDNEHAALLAAALAPDGRARLEVVAVWSGASCTRDMIADLPDLLARVKPRAFGWFGQGPAAALAPELRRLPRQVEIKAGEVTGLCGGLAEQVTARRVLHPNDPLLNAHIFGAQRLYSGDGWRFVRRGAGHCDAAYAAAGALHLARTLPTARKPVVLVGRRAS